METFISPPRSPLKVRTDFAGGLIVVEFSNIATARAFANDARVRNFGQLLTDDLRRFLDGETAETR